MKSALDILELILSKISRNFHGKNYMQGKARPITTSGRESTEIFGVIKYFGQLSLFQPAYTGNNAEPWFSVSNSG
jgi:hypothetical protein